MSKETFTFQTEVSNLLDIVAHSLYSHKEIFLRELISNASDACDKLRYAVLTNPNLSDGSQDYKIIITTDKKNRTLTIEDNGIGMSRDDLSDVLGTIAQSGTQKFVEGLTGDDKKDISLIGQFGVGFYSSFMVSDRVDVLTRKAGEKDAWLWSSDGKGEFSIETAARDASGTVITLHLAKAEDEFLDDHRIRHIVKTYSDHVGVPIVLAQSGDGKTKEGDDDSAPVEETLNTASALWTRPAKDISKDEYNEFYSHVAQAFDEPWLTMHNRVEGVISYANLLFIPSTQPFDLFQSDRKGKVRLYANRVFITDDCESLLPPYFRFIRGVVDSEDLSLNISREMLQHDPKLAKIRSGLLKRVMGALKKKADKSPEDYATFWNTFGAVLKEGIYEDSDNRDKLLAISRFNSTASDNLTDLIGLDDYVKRMKDGQDAIYYITGTDIEQISKSPQLEGFRARGVEVLLLSDPVDEFWITTAGEFSGKSFKSATRSGSDLGEIKTASEKKDKDADTDKPENNGEIDALIAAFKLALGDNVKDVRTSERLTDSPVCLVADENDMDIHLERMLRQHQKIDQLSTRVLEINKDNSLIRILAGRAAKADGEDAFVADAAHLLLDQARIMEGDQVSDPSAFSRRLAAILERGLA